MPGKKGPQASSDILAELELENQLESTEQTLMREQVSLEKAQGQLNLLDKYTKDRMIRDLSSQARRTEIGGAGEGADPPIERDKETRLERQIVNCKLIAPGDGVVVYANDPNRFGSIRPQIEEGATVRERQIIFSVPRHRRRCRSTPRCHESQVDSSRSA